MSCFEIGWLRGSRRHTSVEVLLWSQPTRAHYETGLKPRRMKELANWRGGEAEAVRRERGQVRDVGRRQRGRGIDKGRPKEAVCH